MKNCTAPENHTAGRTRSLACAAILAVAFTVSVSQPAHADKVTPPPVPNGIEVPPGNEAFLVGHSQGTQNYICLPCPNPTTPAAMCPDTSGFAWLLFTPEATLFSDNDKQVTTHFFSPNPVEHGTVRATWQHSRDSSTVWGGQATSAIVSQDAIPWVRLPAAGVQDGPTGGHTLTPTTFIQRLNTVGGVAPFEGCALLSDVGKKAFVPYTADYFFYKKAPGSDADNGD